MVPLHVSDDAIVRCPLCSEEYRLAEATRHLPPQLIVVGPGPIIPAGAAAESKGEEFAFLPPVDAPRAVVLREQSTARPRRQRRARNPLVEGLKIIGGGVIGLVIGQLILWWMPGNWDASNRDPASIARHVARYAPWIVPQNLHSLDTDSEH